MKPRRWFLTPELIKWRYMVACGNFCGPFFVFPCAAYRQYPDWQVVVRRLDERW